VIAEVETRAGWECEACGFTISDKPEFHHRRARGMGGSSAQLLDVAVNLIRIHQRCHAWIHAHPAVSRKHNWIIRRVEEASDLTPKVNPELRRWAA
jgi:hypothetical protein